jgi:hypothetical protein
MSNDGPSGRPSVLWGCIQGIAIIGFGSAIVVIAIYLVIAVVLPILGIQLFDERGLGGPVPSPSN